MTKPVKIHTMRNQTFIHSAEQAVRQQQLSTVVALRTFALLIQLALLIGVYFWLKVALPFEILICIFGGFAIFNAATWLQLHRQRPIGPLALMTQLLLDLLGFSVLLYFTGGVTNPFVSLYLPLLGLAAVLLPLWQVACLALLSVLAYSVLMYEYTPIILHDHATGVHLHLLGMWANFLVSVLMLVGFVARLSASLRKREHDLTLAKSRLVSDERLFELGNQAASIAHRLATPVSTMATILADWQDEPALQHQAEELHVLASQIQLVQATLQQLREQVEHTEATARHNQVSNLRAWLDVFLNDWRNRNPTQEVHYSTPSQSIFAPAPIAIEPRALALALNVLLNNAMQNHQRAGTAQAIEVQFEAKPQHDVLRVLDQNGSATLTIARATP